MKKRKSIRNIELYLKWPLLITAMVFLLSIVIFSVDRTSGIALLGVSVLIALFSIYLYLFCRKGLQASLMDFADSFEKAAVRMLGSMAQPAAVTEPGGRIIWTNDAFGDEFGHAALIQNVFPDITKELLAKLSEDSLIHSGFGERRYAVEMVPMSFAPNRSEDGDMLLSAAEAASDAAQAESGYIFMNISDETELVAYRKAYEETRISEGLIYIDNYEEALASVEDVRKSLLTALVERRINAYVSNHGGVLRKLENDKYFFFIHVADLRRMIDDKFSLLDEVKTINIGNDARVTISIGVGSGGEKLIDNYEYSRAAIEFALGRGGDQAVLKDGTEVRFFGGKSEAQAKNTRVKARVKAQAFRDLLVGCDKLMVMGHKNPDVDSLGAAVGFWRIASTMGKHAWIVIGEPNRSLRPIYDRFANSDLYPDDIFISGEKALEMLDSQTVVVVVDVNRPSITEEPRLLKRARNLAVVDHHRPTREEIEGAVLTYIEPYASSACEMVTEIIEYMDINVRLTAVDADTLYGGIILDTQNFVNQTGVRTLEAASYLRREGANTTRIRKLMRDSYNDFKAKAESIDKAELYRDYFMLSRCRAELADSPTVIGAQAANSLLEIDNVKAAVVFTPFNGRIYVSARSIDEINVQVMMEKIGGGGHMSVAGAQLEDITLEEAVEKVKAVIDEMIDSGEVV